MVVIHMVCSKAFLRGRRDVGIYKALGFTSGKLQLQFVVRFFIVAALGRLWEADFLQCLWREMLSFPLRFIGISRETLINSCISS